MGKIRVLFLCEMNKNRSRTAEAIYSKSPSVEARSAGISKTACLVVTREMMEWAEIVFVMERRQRNKLHKLFPDLYKKKIVCLYIEDQFDFIDSNLVSLIHKRMKDNGFNFTT